MWKKWKRSGAVANGESVLTSSMRQDGYEIGKLLKNSLEEHKLSKQFLADLKILHICLYECPLFSTIAS